MSKIDFEKISSARVRKAYEIAKAAHFGQTDKAGVDYLNHPVAVAENFAGDISAMIVALLHDVVEDTGYSFSDLEVAVPLEPAELAALKLLTHDENISYFDYIAKISGNALAAKVKIADLQHNSDLTRIPENLRTEKDLARVEKYRRALEILRREKICGD